MKAKLQKQILPAIQAIRDTRIANDNGVVKKEFKGYISALGAGIVQAGLLPTTIFFEHKGEASADRQLVCKAIRLLLERKSNPEFIPDNWNAYKLQDYLMDNDRMNDPTVLTAVTEYAVALKIALRTFKIS